LAMIEPAMPHTGRFVLSYLALGGLLVAAVVGLIVLVIRPGQERSAGWSNVEPVRG
jgi:hypothetical protein